MPYPILIDMHVDITTYNLTRAWVDAARWFTGCYRLISECNIFDLSGGILHQLGFTPMVIQGDET